MYIWIIHLICVMKSQIRVGKNHPRVHWDQRHLHPVRDVQPTGWHRRRWKACFAYSVGAISGFEQWPHDEHLGKTYGLILYSEHFLPREWCKCRCVVPSSLYSIIWQETHHSHCSLKWQLHGLWSQSQNYGKAKFVAPQRVFGKTFKESNSCKLCSKP